MTCPRCKRPVARLVEGMCARCTKRFKKMDKPAYNPVTDVDFPTKWSRWI